MFEIFGVIILLPLVLLLLEIVVIGLCLPVVGLIELIKLIYKGLLQIKKDFFN